MTFIHLTKALLCLAIGYSVFAFSSEPAFKSGFRSMQERPSMACGARAPSSMIFPADDPRNYMVQVKIRNTWDRKTLPVPIEVIVCNGGSEPVDLLISNSIAKDFLVVKDIQGKRILPKKNRVTTGSAGEIARPGGTVDVSVSARTIEPHSSFTLGDASLEAGLDLRDNEVYLLSVRQQIFVPSRNKTIVVESLPIKFRIG